MKREPGVGFHQPATTQGARCISVGTQPLRPNETRRQQRILVAYERAITGVAGDVKSAKRSSFVTNKHLLPGCPPARTPL